ncbi:hypothetical protein HOLleu_39025 [Holothuria leucospilota]|uniref:BEN domain-containing protein n=1 Tax=Holothuria leucospilota TaxID=206669 RepID=A0A9Q0YMS8_HOLLE|nr:hypothetical protein HOLleu_39025 [Holothuria leucospilota]
MQNILQLEPAVSSTALNKMATKIFSSTPVVVMWLEPTRDRGKESIVKAREIVKPHRSKLQPGQTALIKWRSSGRVYKAIVKSIQGSKLDAGNTEVVKHGVEPVVGPGDSFELDDEQPLAAFRSSTSDTTPVRNRPLPITEENRSGGGEVEPERTDDEDCDDEQPLDTESDPKPTVLPVINDQPRGNTETWILEREVEPHRCESQREQNQQIRRDIKDLKMEVRSVKSEISEMKTEFSQMLLNYSANLQGQIVNVIGAIHELKEQTESLTNTITQRINRKATMTPPRSLPGTVNAGTPSTPHRDSRDITPLYGLLEGENVKIEVDADNVVFIGKTSYENYFSTSLSASSFLRKLMPHFFTLEEMISSNFEGDVVTATGRVHIKQLDPCKRRALLRQVELEFGGSTKTHEAYAKLKAAVNDKCRTERRKC